MLALSSTLFSGKARLFTTRDRDQVRAVIPLVEQLDHLGPLNWSRLGIPGDTSVSLADILLHPVARRGAPFDRILEELNSEQAWDVLRFARVRQRSNLLSVLGETRFRHARTDAGANAFCDVSGPAALDALSRDNLRNIDRLARRAQRDVGPLGCDSITGPSIAADAFDRFVRIEGSGWKAEPGEGGALTKDSRAKSFFRDVMARFQPDGDARIDFLTIGGRDAAAHLAIRTGPTWFLLKIGYDPAFKDVGPGGILLKHFLEEMRDDPGVAEVNLSTDPRWATRWHFQTEPCYNVQIFNRTWRGRTLAAGRAAMEFAKSARSALSELSGAGLG